MLCCVLVNDTIKQIEREQAKPMSMRGEAGSSPSEKSIRSTMEILVEKDNE
jgi:hypothetical protein